MFGGVERVKHGPFTRRRSSGLKLRPGCESGDLKGTGHIPGADEKQHVECGREKVEQAREWANETREWAPCISQ
jgi:hypothetical protein